MDRNTVINIAASWIGRNEADGSFREIIDTYNSISPLPVGYKVKYTDDWCATFVSAVAQKAGATDIIYPECGCERMINLFKAHDRWVEDDAYIPKPGDIIFYDWDDNGSGDCTGWSDHVGIVYSVIGNNMRIVEGNTSNGVAYTTKTVNQRYIRGYGIPNYTDAVAVVPTVQPTITVADSNIKVGSKVKIIGDTWYNGIAIANWIKQDTWIVLCINGDRVVIDKNEKGTHSIMSPIKITSLELVGSSTNTTVSNIPASTVTETSTKVSEKEIWDYLMSVYNNAYGVAAIMGNLYAESGLISNNLENAAETRLHMSDAEYTKAVDNGSYDNFVNDIAGYGLAQWTWWSRKKALYNYAKSTNRSIGDTKMQLEFLVSELPSFPIVVNAIKAAIDIQTPSDLILCRFENPADQSQNMKNKRAEFARNFYNKYSGATQPVAKPSDNDVIKVGDIVTFNGGKHYVSSYIGIGLQAKAGTARVTAINPGSAHPYHLIHEGRGSNVYGWVDRNTFSK